MGTVGPSHDTRNWGKGALARGHAEYLLALVWGQPGFHWVPTSWLFSLARARNWGKGALERGPAEYLLTLVQWCWSRPVIVCRTLCPDFSLTVPLLPSVLPSPFSLPFLHISSWFCLPSFSSLCMTGKGDANGDTCWRPLDPFTLTFKVLPCKKLGTDLSRKSIA